MNREKVIGAWEIFRKSNPYEICNGREFRAFAEPEYCMGQMIEDTISMLKEQEAVKPRNTYSETPSGKFIPHIFCGNCDKEIYAMYNILPVLWKAY